MTGSFDTMTSGNNRSFGGRDGGTDENETEILAADIRITQERLEETVEEIGERFNPTRLKEELKHDIRDATIGRVENMAQQTAEIVSDAQRTIMQSIRENPVPVAIVGIGLGWMILNARGRQNRSGSSSQHDNQQRRGEGSGYDQQYRRGFESPFDDQQEGHGYNAQPGTFDRARAKAGNVVDSVKHKTSKLVEGTHRSAERVAESAHDAAGVVADETRMQSQRVQRAYHENPLVIGAAALALGLAAGLAIPASEKEVELVSDKLGDLVEKVRDVAEDTKSRVQQVAERVMEEAQSTAKDTAQQVGLMS
jgi:gas vesicle protein